MSILNPFTFIALVILIYSAILHEIAHGYVAERLGDPTARLLGRLTLNPRPHIDPMMSILLPLILILSGSPIIFGGAKPVPIDPFNLKEGRKDVALVSLAGPFTNVILAVSASILFHLLAGNLDPLNTPWGWLLVLQILKTIVSLNILLAVFNLLPIPPLDGSKIFALILPEKTAATYLAIGNLGAGLILFLLLLPTGFQTLIGILYRFCLGLLGF
ncbi:MAG: site-2 protease family protein [bacterium]|nr:site-2 protease family protein [bacterium]